MTRPTQLTINLKALRHNLSRVNHFAPGKKIIAMIKANAYGHGLIRAAQALSEADALGVASLDEGLLLREAGIIKPIVLMQGVFYADELTEAIENDFVLVVHHQSQIEMLEKIQLKKPVSIWLKINTGMHRLGVSKEEFSDCYKRLSILPYVQQPIGLMSHFAYADIADSDATFKQMEVFDSLTRKMKGQKSLANSAAILVHAKSHHNWVRPGLMLYGVSPFANQIGNDYGLQPVMTLSSELISIIPVKKGEKVGYGGKFKAERDMSVGIVTAGYGDGYPQGTENGTPVLINGQIGQLVGRVSMDMLSVDLSNISCAKIGDRVTLWGEGLPVENVVEGNPTSVYEILTRVTSRPHVKIVN